MLLCTWLVSCAVSTEKRSADVTTQSQPVVVALLEQADKASQIGNLEQASAVLERALRIDPGDAMAWHRLAQIRYRQQRYAQAIALAKKSNSLAGGDTNLNQANNTLVEQAEISRKNNPE